MNAEPVFSIVIPVFNGAGYIRRAVESALNQVGVSAEVIVIDDGSSDDSGALAASTAPAVRVIRRKNGGLPSARNLGIRNARGSIVAFLDADDYWAPDKLSSQYRLYVADPEISVVFSDFNSVNEEGRPEGWQGGLDLQLPQYGLKIRRVTEDGHILSGEIVHALIRHTSFMHPSTVTVKRSLLESVGSFDETMSYAEDLELWIRLAAECRMGFVSRALATIEQRANSHGRHLPRMSEQLIRLYSRLPNQFPSLPEDLRKHIEAFIESKHIELGWQYRTSGNFQPAQRHYQAALAYRLRPRTIAALARTYLRF